MSELALYEVAKSALAEAIRIDEVLEVRDAGERAKLYARQAKDRDLQANAVALVVRAERRLGEMLKIIKDQGQLSAGGRPSHSNLSEPETGTDAGPVFDSTGFTLAELGISKNLSSRAQMLADLDEDAFEDDLEAKRKKILAADAGPKMPGKARAVSPKVEKPEALGAEVFHRFAFSVLALTMASDRVSSEAIQFIAEHLGIVDLDGESVDFAPAAMTAMGPLAEVALKALDNENTLAREASGGQPLPDNGDIGDLQHGTQSAPHHLTQLALREAYDGEVVLLGARKGNLTMAEAEPALRKGREAGVSPLLIAGDIGHPLGTVKTWLNRLGLTSLAHMEVLNAGRAAAALARKVGDQ